MRDPIQSSRMTGELATRQDQRRGGKRHEGTRGQRLFGRHSVPTGRGVDTEGRGILPWCVDVLRAPYRRGDGGGLLGLHLEVHEALLEVAHGLEVVHGEDRAVVLRLVHHQLVEGDGRPLRLGRRRGLFSREWRQGRVPATRGGE